MRTPALAEPQERAGLHHPLQRHCPARIAPGAKKSPAGQGPRGAGWRRPTLPPIAGSTIGAGGLNCSVRDGKRWGPAAVAAMPIARHGRGRARQAGGKGGGRGGGSGPARPRRRRPSGARPAARGKPSGH